MPASIRQLVEVASLPAFVEGRYYDVLAANDLAGALEPNLRPGMNRLTSVFLDPADKALYPDWDDITVHLVANFRGAVGSDTDDPRFVQLVGELSLSSERFRYLWGRQDVRTGDGMPMRIHHPQVGDLTLSRNKLAIPSAKGQYLVIYHAEPGTSSADKLALLGSLTTPEIEPIEQSPPASGRERDRDRSPNGDMHPPLEASLAWEAACLACRRAIGRRSLALAAMELPAAATD